MKKQLQIISIFIACAASGAFYACKKQSTNHQTTAQEYMAAVNNWRQESTSHFSKKDVQRIDSIIGLLDYESAAKAHPNDTTTLYLITIKAREGKPNFLAIAETNKKYIFDGIYQAKSAEFINTFFESHVLATNDSILAFGMDNHPLKGWAGNRDKGVSTLRGEGRSIKIASIANLKSAKYKVNSYGEDEPCIYWYWIAYDPYTGEEYSYTFMYSTGPCDGFSGGGSVEQQDLLCGFAQSDFLAAFDHASVDEIDEVSMSFGSPYTEPNGDIKVAVTPFWRCVKFDMGILGSEIISGTYAGHIYKVNSIDNMWKWSDLSFSRLDITQGNLPFCITTTLNSPTSSMTQQNETSWQASLAFSGTVSSVIPGIGPKNQAIYFNGMHWFVAGMD